MSANLDNSAVGTRSQFSFQSQTRPMPNNVQIITQLLSLYTLTRKCSKILQVRLQQYVNWEIPDVQAEFRKGRGTRDQIANIRWIIKKQESSRKTSTSALLTTPKPLTVWITTNCGKFFKRWEYQTTLPASWETCMQVKKQQFKLDMEQLTCYKLGKE